MRSLLLNTASDSSFAARATLLRLLIAKHSLAMRCHALFLPIVLTSMIGCAESFAQEKKRLCNVLRPFLELRCWSCAIPPGENIVEGAQQWLATWTPPASLMQNVSLNPLL